MGRAKAKNQAEMVSRTNKNIPEEKFIEMLRPGKGHFSDAGFIGKEEDYFKLLEDDLALLEKYGITHQQLGEYLEDIVKLARTLQYQRIEVQEINYRRFKQLGLHKKVLI